MHPVIRAAVVVAALTALSASVQRNARARSVRFAHAQPNAHDEMSAICPPDMLPDSDQCVPIPSGTTLDSEAGQDLIGEVNGHRDPNGRWTTYEQIPRLPDRPADYNSYRYPIPPPGSGHFSVGPYDLDRPDTAQRRGAGLHFTGHGGVDLLQARGTEVRSLRLEHQQGDTQVVFVGKLFGTCVVTRHTVRESGRVRDYVVMHGHLDATAPGLKSGDRIQEGDLLGYVGDTGSEGIVHLHFEVRQVRDGIDEPTELSPAVMSPSVSIPCDPRNVLPRL